MANKYLDYGGVQTLWNAIKDRDNVMSSKKAGYIHYDESEKVIQLWASESDFTAYNVADNKHADGVPQPLSEMNAAAFVKDGMLHDVKVISAREAGGITYVPQGSATAQYYNEDELFIQFVWNTDGESKEDYVLLTDIAPVYTEGEGIDITNNKISFEGGKSNQIKTDRSIKLGGTELAALLAKDGITSIDANTDLTSLFIKLLSVETWPTIGTNVSALSISNPGPTIIGYTSAAGTGVVSSNVEAGTKVWLTIQGQDASASASRTYAGFDNGYSIVPSTSSSFTVYPGNPSTVSITGSENSGENYSITVSGYADTFFGDIPALSSNKNAEYVALSQRHQFTVGEGSATITATQTTPGFSATVPPINNTYYGVSTLDATSEDCKISPADGYTITANGTSVSSTYQITGYRKLFYGSFDEYDLSLLNSDNIRAAVGGAASSSAAAASTYNINAKGKHLAWIAFPATKSWKVKKSLVDGVDLSDFAGEWKSTTVSVAGANGYNPISYTVYYADGGTSGWTGEKLNVTIG